MHGRIPRLVLAAPLAAALAVTLTASGGVPRIGIDADMPALRSISSRLDGAISTVLIEASEPVAYLTSQPDPLTVLVDLRNVTAGGLDGAPVTAMLAPIAGVVIEGASAPDGAPVARVRVRLDRAAKHRVRSSRNTILVEVERTGSALTATPAPVRLTASAEATVVKKPDTREVRLTASADATVVKKPDATFAPKAAPRAIATRAAATELRSIKAGEMPNGFAITLAGNGPLVASSVQDARDLPARVLLDFAGVAAGRAAAITPVNTGGIERVRVATNSRDPLITRVVIDLARAIPYTIETVGEEIRVLFSRAVELATAREVPAPVAQPREPAEAAPATVTPVVAPVPTPAPPVLTPAVASFGREGGQAAAASPLQGATNAQGQRTFTGDPVTLDFQGADLRAVLRTFAEISGLNVVIDPSIQGTVDVALRDVPWDQALDIILRANKLGYSVDGTIVRIVPMNVLAQETEDRKKLADANALAGELRIITRPLSYAKAADLVPIITKSSLSARGEVQIDVRTNTLIIRDLADRLQAATDLIAALDRPQPQVEIEARIVRLNRDSSKELGIQWGFDGRVDPSVGTSTGLTFPSSAVASGGTGVTGAGNSALGLVLGSINGALKLDVQLRALETQRRLRILSSPRVTTQNNVPAEIAQGQRIPVQTVANQTVTTTYVDAALTLKVTPQITAADTVIMTIAVDNGSADAPGPDGSRVINTQRAGTTVLVANGDTTVIGGIFQSSEGTVSDSTPFLHRIPLLGWLFKSQQDISEIGELLIFITPKILK